MPYSWDVTSGDLLRFLLLGCVTTKGEGILILTIVFKVMPDHSGMEDNEEMKCMHFEGALDEGKHASGLSQRGVYLSYWTH